MTELDAPYLRFPFSAGIGIRGQIKRRLKSAAWACGFDIEFEEEKGLLSSEYRVTVTGGTAEELMKFSNSIDRWFEAIADD